MVTTFEKTASFRDKVDQLSINFYLVMSLDRQAVLKAAASVEWRDTTSIGNLNIEVLLLEWFTLVSNACQIKKIIDSI